MLLRCSFLTILLGLCITAQVPCRPSTTECCYKPLPENIYEYHCRGAVIKVIPKEVEINCQEEDDQPIQETYWDTSYFPPLKNVENIEFLQIRCCPFPRNIKKILNDLKINTVEVLTVDYTKNFRNIVLRPDYFQGLGGLKELLLDNNNFDGIEKNFFIELRNVNRTTLISNNLQSLPDHMFEYADELQRLDLSGNKFHYLSENIFQNTTNLTELVLRENQLIDINNQTFRNLRNLVKLYLSYNNITKLSENSFSGLKNLKVIELQENQFTSLPKNIFKENLNLVTVKINSNQLLTDLPDSLFANLTNLKIVNLEDCNLTVLPKDLFEGCGNLQNIILMRNKLKSLPETIFRDLKNLRNMDLSFNKLGELPSELFQSLTMLKVLNLRNNGLVNLNRTIFDKLIYLEEINLENNLLTEFHGILFLKSTHLREIILSNNRIAISKRDNPIPYNILINLEKLDLSYNRINWYSHDWITMRDTLRELDLSHNQIKTIRFQDIYEEDLQLNINFTYNNISVMNFTMAESITINQTSQKISKSKYKIVVHLDSNPIDCNCNSYDLIKYLNIVNPYVVIEAEKLYCTSPSNLIGSSVKNLAPEMVKCTSDQLGIKPCSDICDCDFRPWDRALLINCENKNLIRVPKLTLPTNLDYNQTHVNLANNLLKSGPIQGMGYENVTKMMLSFNNINELTWMPPKLEILSLDNNNINQIDHDMLIMLNSSRLTNISLGGNPYICDCSTVNLYKFLVSLFWNKRIDVNNIKCKNGGNSLVHLTTNDLCPTSQVAMYVGYSILAIIILMMCIFIFLFYRYKIEVINRLHQYIPSWFPKLKYDAFICYSHKDEDFVIREIVSVLERGPNPYKLCIHIRDWTPGKVIFEQIIKSVENSRRTLIILSPNFLESIWGLLEFKMAHSQAMMDGRGKVIVVLYGDIDLNADLDDVLKSYMKTNTYLKWGDNNFWDKLRRALDDPQPDSEIQLSQKDQNIAITLKDNLEVNDSSAKKLTNGTASSRITVDSLLPNITETDSSQKC